MLHFKSTLILLVLAASAGWSAPSVDFVPGQGETDTLKEPIPYEGDRTTDILVVVPPEGKDLNLELEKHETPDIIDPISLVRKSITGRLISVEHDDQTTPTPVEEGMPSWQLWLIWGAIGTTAIICICQYVAAKVAFFILRDPSLRRQLFNPK